MLTYPICRSLCFDLCHCVFIALGAAIMRTVSRHISLCLIASHCVVLCLPTVSSLCVTMSQCVSSYLVVSHYITLCLRLYCASPLIVPHCASPHASCLWCRCIMLVVYMHHARGADASHWLQVFYICISESDEMLDYLRGTPDVMQLFVRYCSWHLISDPPARHVIDFSQDQSGDCALPGCLLCASCLSRSCCTTCSHCLCALCLCSHCLCCELYGLTFSLARYMCSHSHCAFVALILCALNLTVLSVCSHMFRHTAVVAAVTASNQQLSQQALIRHAYDSMCALTHVRPLSVL